MKSRQQKLIDLGLPEAAGICRNTQEALLRQIVEHLLEKVHGTTDDTPPGDRAEVKRTGTGGLPATIHTRIWATLCSTNTFGAAADRAPRVREILASVLCEEGGAGDLPSATAVVSTFLTTTSNGYNTAYVAPPLSYIENIIPNPLLLARVAIKLRRRVSVCVSAALRAALENAKEVVTSRLASYDVAKDKALQPHRFASLCKALHSLVETLLALPSAAEDDIVSMVDKLLSPDGMTPAVYINGFVARLDKVRAGEELLLQKHLGAHLLCSRQGCNQSFLAS